MKIHLKAQRLTLAALATGVAGASAFGTTRMMQVPAQAQEAAAATAPAKPKATVDAAALALLKKMDAAYKGLSSYSGQMSNVDGEGTGKTSEGSIQWVKPNMFKVSFGNDKSTTTAVSDGTTLYASSSSDKARYLKVAAPKDASALPVALSSSSAGNLLLPILLGGNSLVDIFSLDKPTGTMSLAMGAEDTIAGTPVDVVMATRPAGKSSVMFSFALGKDDHLVRQVKISTKDEDAEAKPVSTETHSGIKSSMAAGGAAAGGAMAGGAMAGGMTAADFKFTPLAGVKAVESLAPPMYDQSLKAGATPIAFTAPDLEGKTLDLSQYKGKVVLLDFWATWCGPCVAEAPNIISAYNKYHGQGFDVLGVSLDSSRPALDKYIAEHKMPWRQVFDGKGWGSRVPGLYGVRSIPFAMLLGRDGKISTLNVRGEALEPAIKAALAKK